MKEAIQIEDAVVLPAEAINAIVADIHADNVTAGWWTDIRFADKLAVLTRAGYDPVHAKDLLAELGITESTVATRNIGELLCLTHSELSEGVEGARKNLMDDKLPHRSMLEVELADAVIRIFDIAGSRGFDLGGAIMEKRRYNAKRADHKIASRLSDNGKQF